MMRASLLAIDTSASSPHTRPAPTAGPRIALTTGFILLLPIAGLIFLAETVSVILQVGSFKLRGKRIFRMAPFHIHFELLGWPEEKVTIRFWIIGAVAGIAAAILAFATPVS